MRKLIFFFSCFIVGLAAADTADLGPTQSAYFANLQAACGARYEGEMTFPVDGQDDFAGKLLVAEFSVCDASEVRIPFAVGTDTSRTWVIRPTAAALELKHDHRHADGTPDDVTNYGGLAPATTGIDNSTATSTANTGTPLAQSFAADAYTQQLIPAAATNVWTLSFSADMQTLTYHLTRHGKPRFTAVLQRTAAAPTSAAVDIAIELK